MVFDDTSDSYKHIVSLRLWECNIGDEGVAHLCNFLSTNKSIETLDLLKNKITDAGCEFMGRVLGPTSETPLKILHLDHNPIGSSGVEKLTNGLCQNKAINVLTINHAGLDAKCAPSLSRILVFIHSTLKELELIGNQLKSRGVAEILPAAKISKKLVMLNVSDNQVEDSQTLFDNLSDLSVNSRCVRRINLGYNFLTNDFIRQVLQPLEDGKKITEINFGIKIDPQLRLKLKATLVENKKIAKKAKKKKKKGKKGKKGKKKKK